MTVETPRTLSQVLTDAVNELEGKTATLSEISNKLGVRAYGAFIVLMTLPSFIPGISLFSGAFLLLFSVQMALGIEHPWFPKSIRQVEIKMATLQKGLNKGLPHLAKIEHYIKPRFVWLNSNIAIRLIGVLIAFFSFVVMLPIPLGNFVPSIALLFVAFGMLQKDGLVTSISLLLGTVYCVGFLWFTWGVMNRLIDFF